MDTKNFFNDPKKQHSFDASQDLKIQYKLIKPHPNQHFNKSKVVQMMAKTNNSSLVDYSSSQSSDQSSSEVPIEKTSSIYTGVLHEHRNYHGGGGIKERIIATLGRQNLSKLLKKKGQKNFDFYMHKGHQLWVSNNGSNKPEYDTGCDIFIYETGKIIIETCVRDVEFSNFYKRQETITIDIYPLN